MIWILPSTVESLTESYSSDPEVSEVLGRTEYDHGEGGTSNKIEVAIDLEDDQFGMTMRHELGHALGVPHSDIKGTIMYPSAPFSSEHITCADVKSFCIVWECDYMRMPLCR